MFIVLLITVLILKCVSYIWEKRRLIQLYRSLKNDIPAYPIIGHGYIALGSEEDRMTAFKLLGNEAIKHGGISRFLLLHKIGIVVADAEIAEVIFRNCLSKTDSAKMARRLIGNGSIFAEVPIWRPRRKILAPAFALKHLNSFIAIFNKNSRALANKLDKMVAKGPFPTSKYFSAFTMDSLCESSLDCQVDAPDSPNQPFTHAFEEYCRMMSERVVAPWLYNDMIFFNLPWYKKIKDHIKYMQDFVDKTIKAKRKQIQMEEEIKTVDINKDAKPCNVTMLDLLITRSSASEGYTDLELREELLVITLAGTDTLSRGLGFLVMMLAMHQDVQDKVCEEMESIFGSSSRSVTTEDLNKMKYLDAVIKETLRLFPPIPVIVRSADNDITLPSGLVLPNGTEIVLNLYSLNRNPRYWGEDADEFDPTRFLSKQLTHPAAMGSFSYGPRGCLGAQYATMAMKTVISTLVQRFRILPAKELKQLRLKFDIMLREVDNFPVRLEKRVTRQKEYVNHEEKKEDEMDIYGDGYQISGRP